MKKPIKVNPLAHHFQPRAFPPEFSAAMRHYQQVEARHGEDSAEANDAFMRAMVLAPQWFMDQVTTDFQADNPDWLPPPDGYDDDGQPVYASTTLARHLGVSHDQMINNIERLQAVHADTGTACGIRPATDQIHRRQ